MSGTVLVVGGAGYIGAHVVEELMAAGYNPVIYDNLLGGGVNLKGLKKYKLVKGDVGDGELLRWAIRTHQPSSVIHLAGRIEVGISVRSPGLFWESNTLRPMALLEAMRAFNLKRLVFSSTCAVHGSASGEEALTEHHPLVPESTYAASKLAFEYALESYRAAYGLEPVVLRYFNAAGASTTSDIGEAHRIETHLIPLLLRAADSDGLVNVFGTEHPTLDGTCIRDYVHVTDLARAHIAALHPAYNGKTYDNTYNLGTGRGHSVLEVIAMVEQVTGKKVRWTPAAARAGAPPTLVADPSKAEYALSWKPTTSSLQHIIETAWQYHQRRSRPMSNRMQGDT